MNWGATGIGFIAPVIGFVVPYLALRRSKVNDKVVAASGVVTESRAGAQLVIDGLSKLLDQTQESETGFREQLVVCATGAKELAVDRDLWREKALRYERIHGPLP